MRIIEQIQELRAELIRFAPEKKQIIGLRTLADSSTKQGKLIAMAAEGKPEHEIAEALGYTFGSQNYNVRKSNTYRRLLNSVFLYQLRGRGMSEYAVRLFHSGKMVFAARMLSYLRSQRVAESVARRGLCVAEAYQFSDHAIQYLQILQQGAVLAGNRPKFKKYSAQLSRWLRIQQTEAEVMTAVFDIMMTFTRRGSEHPGSRDKALNTSYAAEEAYKELGTFNLGLAFYRLRSMGLQAGGEYQQCIEVCLEAEQFVERDPKFYSTARVAEFALRRLSCAAQVRNQAHGTEAAAKCELVYTPGEVNWFVLMENLFVIHMHNLDFPAARELYQRVTGMKGYQNLPEFRQQRWLVYHIYLLFAERALKPGTKLDFKPIPTVREFVKWIPSFTGDKTGFYAAVLVLHILYLIEARRWKEVYERVESLNAYRRRHLRGRSRQLDLFLQMISSLEVAEFKYELIKPKTAALEEKLRHYSTTSQKLEGTQVLPYEWLWTRVLESLR